VGATSLFTTIEDAAKWLLNFQTGKVGGKQVIKQMHQPSTINNGKKLKYGFGFNMDTYKGWKRIANGGADAGYRTILCRFPEKELGIIIFSNLSIANPYNMAMQIADLFLEDKSSQATAVSSTSQSIDTTLYKHFVGSYASDQGLVMETYMDSSKLFLKFNQYPFLMTPTTKNKFTVMDGYFTYEFDSPTKGQSPGVKGTFGDEEFYAKRFSPYTLTDKKRATYVGTYYNEELGATYQVVQENNQLLLRHRKHADIALQSTSPNQFSTNQWWLSNLNFQEDNKGNITGFEVNDYRILHLKFKRVK
jgi:hypothetical protein